MRQRPSLPMGTNILGTAWSSYAKLSLLLFRFVEDELPSNTYNIFVHFP